MSFTPRVWNKLHITGAEDDVEEFEKRATNGDVINPKLRFEAFVHPPYLFHRLEVVSEEAALALEEQRMSLYHLKSRKEWCERYWGSSDEPLFVQVTHGDDDDIEIEFETYNEPPHKVVEAMALMFPGLTIYHDWIYMEDSRRGFRSYRFGELYGEQDLTPATPDSNG